MRFCQEFQQLLQKANVPIKSSLHWANLEKSPDGSLPVAETESVSVVLDWKATESTCDDVFNNQIVLSTIPITPYCWIQPSSDHAFSSGDEFDYNLPVLEIGDLILQREEISSVLSIMFVESSEE